MTDPTDTSHQVALDQLVAALNPHVVAGQQRLALIMRRLIHHACPQLLRSLELDDDAPFLEPLGFLHFASNPHGDPTPAYAGYIPATQRPELTLTADGSGRAYIPRLGCADVAAPGSEVQLDWACAADRQSAIDWRSLPVVGEPCVEFASERLVALNPCFAEDGGGAVEVEVVSDPELVNDLRGALAAVAQSSPALYGLVARVARLVVVFRHDGLNSFASPRAHGVAFINSRLGLTVPALVEDLTHQFGHTLFTAAAGDGEVYLAERPDRSLGTITGELRDERPLLVALHGVLTESLIVGALDRCLTQALFEADERVEALGRLTFVARRLAIDLENFSTPNVLTPAGEQLVGCMRAVLQAAVKHHGAVIAVLNLGQQGYSFDPKAFEAANPRTLEMT